MQKLLPPALFALFVMLMLGVHVLVSPALGVPAWLRVAGGVFAALGVALAVVARAGFARARTNIHTFRRPDVLVTEGPFRLSRNPMYLGFVLALLGLALGLGSVSALALVVVFWLIVNSWYIPFEERVMRETFGDSYTRYARRTRRWL